MRCFDDDNIIHVVEDVNKPESVDPIRDIDAIDLELILADLEVVSNRLGRQQKAAKTGNKAAAAEAAWLADLAAWLEGGKPARSFDFDESDDAVKAARKELGLLSAKPVIYACNVGEDDLLGGLDENPYFPLVAARAKEENAQAIPICAKTEEDIAGSTQEEKNCVPAGNGHRVHRSGQAHQGQLRAAGPHQLPDRRQEGMPRLDHQEGHQGPAGCRQNPQRL